MRLVDPTRYALDVVHLGQRPAEISKAEAAGVKSVPALVTGGEVLHLNYGAALSDLRS